MTATIIEFPSPAAPLNETENAMIDALRATYTDGGLEAFDRAVQRQLFALAAIIRHVEGRRRLQELLDIASILD